MTGLKGLSHLKNKWLLKLGRFKLTVKENWKRMMKDLCRLFLMVLIFSAVSLLINR